MEEIQKVMENELNKYRQQVQDEKANAESISMKHQIELEQLKAEVEENLPQVAQAAGI